MTLLLDQNVPQQIADFLRGKRPEWRVCLPTSPTGKSHRGKFDQDFADTRMYRVGSHAGVIRLRVWPTTMEQTEKGLCRLLESVEDRDLVESLVIVDDQRIRVRKKARHG